MSNYIDKSINLVTYAGFTGGGVICDILNLESSPVGPWNNIKNRHHNLGKVDTVDWHTGRGFDVDSFYEKIERHSKKLKNKKYWFGTHCWPGEFDTEKFDKILNITTETQLSKIYRHCRVFYTSMGGQFPDWQNKNDRTKPLLVKDVTEYNKPFGRVNKPNIINLEFQSIVECDELFKSTMLELIGVQYFTHIEKRMTVWKDVNSFLYDHRLDIVKNLWESQNL